MQPNIVRRAVRQAARRSDIFIASTALLHHHRYYTHTMASAISVPEHVQHDVKLSAVYKAMNQIAPLRLADSSWDNVGVLLQAAEPNKNTGRVVLLCEDLTTAVVDEALARRGDDATAVIVTYHPIIFRGLKAITLGDTQQRSLLRLAAANVSVYAAHTSLDACTNGINDWLTRVVTGSRPHDDTPLDALCAPIEALSSSEQQHPNAGQGRLVHFQSDRPASVRQLVSNVKRNLELSHVIVGLPQGRTLDESFVRTVAVAAGSAGSVVSKAASAHVWLTGELSHHEALAAVEKGKVIILTLHGNSERAYLRHVLQAKLQAHLNPLGAKLSVIVSRSDKEPLEIM